MRSLATVQIITGISPIANADFIELAHVLGWQCVVKKGEYQPGDKAVYFEVDSFLPERECFEFLRKSSYRENEYMNFKGFRLRTQCMRGEYSQGLLMRLADLGLPEDLATGTDVTEMLGVKKWELPEIAGSEGIMIGELPDIVPKTDEVRVQSIPEILVEFAGKPYYITTKMDGTSRSVGIDESGIFRMTGHHFEYKDDPEGNGFVRLIRTHRVEENLRGYMLRNPWIRSIVLQGELCGQGIQKNRLKLARPDWFVFTAIINRKRTDLNTLIGLCGATGMSMVPIEETGDDLLAKYPNIEALLKRAEGTYPNGGQKEGIVIRPVTPVYSNVLNADLSMKVLNNKYLLKNEN